jgi:hypothetical protein
MSSSCVSVTIARAPIVPPSASAPVSPMKMRAGAAFHHRNPAAAPAAPAATMAVSSAASVFRG